MNLVVISHKSIWGSENSPSGYASDGGFPIQMQALSEIFSETILLLPENKKMCHHGEIFLHGKNLSVKPLIKVPGKGITRKLLFPIWLIFNFKKIYSSFKYADAIHAPIPGDVGTVGIMLAVIMNKPLFVRYCGSWSNIRTFTEWFWHWLIELLAGGKNVIMATGWSPDLPSKKNSNIKWIFSTSLSQEELIKIASLNQGVREVGSRLIIVCRQEPEKGTSVVIDSLPMISELFPDVKLEIVGDGSAIKDLQKKVAQSSLEDIVAFRGRINHIEVINALMEANLFCFPTKSEGFPKVILEAMACGLPIVVTPVSVLTHLACQGAGEIIPYNNPELFSRSVISILNDPEKYKKMSKTAQELAKQYSIENWQNKIKEELTSAWGNIGD